MVCTHMRSKVSRWDRATHIPPLGVGSSAQAPGVPSCPVRQEGSRAPGS